MKSNQVETKNTLNSHTISLGEACFVATFLKKSQLRNFSSPFDWVKGSDLITRLELLLNDFKDFFPIEELICMTDFFDKHLRCHNIDTSSDTYDIYYNKKTCMYFNHDIPRGTILEEYYPMAMEKYQRRITRLLEIMHSADLIRLLYIDMPRQQTSLPSMAKITELLVHLNFKFIKPHITLLYLQYKAEEEKTYSSVDMKKDSNFLYAFKKVHKYLYTAEYSNNNVQKTLESGQADMQDMLTFLGK